VLRVQCAKVASCYFCEPEKLIQVPKGAPNKKKHRR
jgi:hypothetical protein